MSNIYIYENIILYCFIFFYLNIGKLFYYDLIFYFNNDLHFYNMIIFTILMPRDIQILTYILYLKFFIYI